LQIRYILIVVIVGASLLLAVVGNNSNITIATQANQVATSTVTVGSSLTTSQTQPQQLVSRAFKVISTTGTNLHCELWNFTFMGSQGQYASGNFTSDIPLDFYLIQDTSYQDWLRAGSCGNAADAIVSKQSTMSYGFDAALPSSGKWDLVLVNFSNTRDADGFIVAYLSSGSYTITQLLLSTITTTSTLTNSTTTASTTNIPGFPVESIAIGFMAGLVALMVLRHQRLKRR